jgi:hypothetical protein
MRRTKNENANGADKGERFPVNKNAIGKLFEPVGKFFGWIAKGSKRHPPCRS